MSDRDVAITFVRWICIRAVFHRGYWLVASLYLVAEADLNAFQLVFIGTAQSLFALAFEVPTGVMADTISRKWSIVIAHALIGTGMLATGFLTSFPALVLTQIIWGIGWTFTSGAEVAWLTDETDRPDRVDGVLTASARWEQVGSACGIVGLGTLAWATDLATAIVVSGVAMLLLGVWVALRFSEHRFTPTRERHWHASLDILRRGISLAGRDRVILLVFAATLLVNGASEGYGRLYAKQLVELGLPIFLEPIVWLTTLNLLMLGLGALALRIVEAHIDGRGVAPQAYAAACFIGALGLGALALAPDAVTGMAAALLVGGVAWPVTRTVSVIWVNRRAPSDVRATVQSFLAQAEYVGEISLGLLLGVLAQATTIGLAMIGSCVLVVWAGLLAVRSDDAPASEGEQSKGAEPPETRAAEHDMAENLASATGASASEAAPAAPGTESSVSTLYLVESAETSQASTSVSMMPDSPEEPVTSVAPRSESSIREVPDPGNVIVSGVETAREPEVGDGHTAKDGVLEAAEKPERAEPREA